MADRRHALDDTLEQLDATLRAGDRQAAMELYLAVDAELTRYVHGEEQLLFPALDRYTSVPVTATTTMRDEHRSLRRLLDALGVLIARAQEGRGLDVLSSLRSVLLLHLEKEEWVLQPLRSPAAT